MDLKAAHKILLELTPPKKKKKNPYCVSQNKIQDQFSEVITGIL